MNLVRALGLEEASVIGVCGSGGKTSLMAAITREFASSDERVLATATTKLGIGEMDGPWRPLQVLDARDLACATPRDDPSAVLAYCGIDRESGKLIGLPPDVIDAVEAAGRFDRIVVETDGSRRMPLKAPASHEPVFPETTDTVIIVAGATGLGQPVERAVFRPERWCELAGGTGSAEATPESLARVVVHPDGSARTAPPAARRILFINQADNPALLRAANEVLDWVFKLDGATPDRAVVGRLAPEPHITVTRNREQCSVGGLLDPRSNDESRFRQCR